VARSEVLSKTSGSRLGSTTTKVKPHFLGPNFTIGSRKPAKDTRWALGSALPNRLARVFRAGLCGSERKR
jgi:hypothetical protein